MKRKSTLHKVLYTIGAVAVVTVLSLIPVPGVSQTYMKAIFSKVDMLNFINIFSGGSLSRMTIGAFGISSYITASLILQQMTIVFPSLEKTRNDGATGRKRYERLEAILAVAIAAVSGTLLANAFRYSPLFADSSLAACAAAVAFWSAGAWGVIRIAKSIDRKGIGNGISVVLGANIISGFPAAFISYFRLYVIGQPAVRAFVYGGGIVLGTAFLILLGIILSQSAIRIEIIQSRKQASVISQKGIIPISAGAISVLPAVYALSLMALPSFAVTVMNIRPKGILKTVIEMTSAQSWTAPTKWTHIAGLVMFIGLVVISAFASCELSINAKEIAAHMKRNGDMIENVAPGEITERFIEKRANVMTVMNIVIIAATVLLPSLVCSIAGIGGASFLGTSMLIAVAVLVDIHERYTASRICDGKAVELPKEPKRKAVSAEHKGLSVFREISFPTCRAKTVGILRCAIIMAGTGSVLSGFGYALSQAVAFVLH
jgi:preprotein translocase subunit SecY